MLLSVRVLVTAIERKLGQQSQDSGRAAALVFVGVGDLKSGLPVCTVDTY